LELVSIRSDLPRLFLGPGKRGVEVRGIPLKPK
jgi:hypothetical protein